MYSCLVSSNLLPSSLELKSVSDQVHLHSGRQVLCADMNLLSRTNLWSNNVAKNLCQGNFRTQFRPCHSTVLDFRLVFLVPPRELWWSCMCRLLLSKSQTHFLPKWKQVSAANISCRGWEEYVQILSTADFLDSVMDLTSIVCTSHGRKASQQLYHLNKIQTFIVLKPYLVPNLDVISLRIVQFRFYVLKFSSLF